MRGMFSLHRLWANNLFLWRLLPFFIGYPKLIGTRNWEKFSFFFFLQQFIYFLSSASSFLVSIFKFYYLFPLLFLIENIDSCVVYVLSAVFTDVDCVKLFVCTWNIFADGKLRLLFGRNIGVFFMRINIWKQKLKFYTESKMNAPLLNEI